MNTAGRSILIIEDDQRLAALVRNYLLRHEFNAKAVEDGAAGIAACRHGNPDVVILDLMLPDIDGITVCRSLRKFYRGRVLMLTASSSDIDQVTGLEVGADDYVVKPAEPRVLLARIRALLRRRDSSLQQAQAGQPLRFGQLLIDLESKSVSLRDQPIKLTSHEFDLLCLLANKPGVVLSRDELFRNLRGIDYDGVDRAVDVKISRLRRKLGDTVGVPTRIKTIWGRGYLFVPNAWND